MTLRTLNYGNYGIFLIMGNAGFCPSTVWLVFLFRIVSGMGPTSNHAPVLSNIGALIIRIGFAGPLYYYYKK